jgi:hypothetical protein
MKKKVIINNIPKTEYKKIENFTTLESSKSSFNNPIEIMEFK